MIELVSAERCIKCDICIKACPDNVFDTGDDGVPILARKGDCQTCFLCELYCPADALYVSPLRDRDDPVNEAELLASGLMGSFARAMGWRNAKPKGTANDKTFLMFDTKDG